jgi:hypothetical protein
LETESTDLDTARVALAQLPRRSGVHSKSGGNQMSDRKLAVKVRVYRIAMAVASIAAIIEVLGAGRRF